MIWATVVLPDPDVPTTKMRLIVSYSSYLAIDSTDPLGTVIESTQPKLRQKEPISPHTSLMLSDGPTANPH